MRKILVASFLGLFLSNVTILSINGWGEFSMRNYYFFEFSLTKHFNFLLFPAAKSLNAGARRELNICMDIVFFK